MDLVEGGKGEQVGLNSSKIRCYSTCIQYVQLKVIVEFVAVCSQYQGGLCVCFALTEHHQILFLHFEKSPIANEGVTKSPFFRCIPSIFQNRAVQALKITLKSHWCANPALTSGIENATSCVHKSTVNVTLYKCSSWKRTSL